MRIKESCNRLQGGWDYCVDHQVILKADVYCTFACAASHPRADGVHSVMMKNHEGCKLAWLCQDHGLEKRS